MLFIAFLVLLMRPCFAGIDFSMNADAKREAFYNGYEIKDFKSAQEAIDWANQVKWIEPIRRLLVRKMHNLAVVSKVLFNDGTARGSELGSDLMAQWSRCNEALKLIEDYKKRGIKGDEAQLGSSVYFYSEVVK